MGLMINGTWHENAPETNKDGYFERGETAFRNWITPDGRPGPTGQDGFRAMT
jgi:putative glutathione S-transferase